MPDWSHLPSVGAAGELLPFMSHRDREHTAFAIFEQAGGHERIVDVLERDDDKFFEWAKKLFVERLPKPNTAVDVNHKHTVEGMLKRLAKAEAAGEIVEGEFEEVGDATGQEPE